MLALRQHNFPLGNRSQLESMAIKTAALARESFASANVLADMRDTLGNLSHGKLFPAGAVVSTGGQQQQGSSDPIQVIPKRTYFLGRILDSTSPSPLADEDKLTNDEVLHIDGKSLPRITCRGLKIRHRGLLAPHGLDWQLEEWFDDECNFLNTGYLRYMSI